MYSHKGILIRKNIIKERKKLFKNKFSDPIERDRIVKKYKIDLDRINKTELKLN
jgi:hypothetical protein